MIEAERVGQGRKLLLVHGLGGSWQSWSPVLGALAAERTVIALDLPGHGGSPAQPDSGTFAGLADSLERYIADNDLRGVDIAGASLGGRLVLEMARRGAVGNVVALDPGGFWQGWERGYFKWTLSASHRLVRLLRGQLPRLSASPGRPHGVARPALRAAVGPLARTGRARAGGVRCHCDGRPAYPRPCGRHGAARTGRAISRAHDYRLGPERSALSSAPGGSGSSRLSRCTVPLVRRKWSLSDLGLSAARG